MLTSSLATASSSINFPLQECFNRNTIPSCLPLKHPLITIKQHLIQVWQSYGHPGYEQIFSSLKDSCHILFTFLGTRGRYYQCPIRRPNVSEVSIFNWQFFSSSWMTVCWLLLWNVITIGCKEDHFLRKI